MKLCDNECQPLCDFCIFYERDDNVKDVDCDGICSKTKVEVSYGDSCDDFECFLYNKT